MILPFFHEIKQSQNILIAGAGGGFDVFCGLPLYFWLRKDGKTVHLANLSFTELGFCDGERPVPSMVRVLPNTSGPQNYLHGTFGGHRSLPCNSPENQTLAGHPVLTKK